MIGGPGGLLRIETTDADRSALAAIDELGVTPSRLGEFDFSDIVVVKPWGYEYLVHEEGDKTICAWVLHVNGDSRGTSLHCHRNKKTRVVALNGTVLVNSLHAQFVLSEGDGLIIDEGAFHSIAARDTNSVLTEIESPSFKPDAVRWKDALGRERQEYEAQCRLVDISQISCPYRALRDKREEVSRLLWETADIFGIPKSQM